MLACGVLACLQLFCGDALMQSQESQAECWDVKLAEVRSCCEESRLDLERQWHRQAQEPHPVQRVSSLLQVSIILSVNHGVHNIN